jgi:hypothetical protein
MNYSYNPIILLSPHENRLDSPHYPQLTSLWKHPPIGFSRGFSTFFCRFSQNPQGEHASTGVENLHIGIPLFSPTTLVPWCHQLHRKIPQRPQRDGFPTHITIYVYMYSYMYIYICIALKPPFSSGMFGCRWFD